MTSLYTLSYNTLEIMEFIARNGIEHTYDCLIQGLSKETANRIIQESKMHHGEHPEQKIESIAGDNKGDK